MKKFSVAAVLACLAALLIIPAGALEYTFDAPPDCLFAEPTSDDTIYKWEDPNTDRSKDAALLPPPFGSSGNTVSGGITPVGEAETGVGPIQYPKAGAAEQAPAFTQVASDLYSADGSLGTIQIPSIGLTVKIFEGTDSAALAKGAGHFAGTSIWAGNVCVAGHNRGVNACFGQIHTLNMGNTVILTTKLGARNYAVSSVTKVSVNDTSGLSDTAHNQITLYTCVENQPAYRWCVKAVEIV